MTKERSKIRLENGKFFELYFKKRSSEKISGRKSQFFWEISKKVIENLAYREIYFTKKALVESIK